MRSVAGVMRKLLPVPLAATAWVAVLFGTLWFDEWRVKTFCPPGLREGSVCYAEVWEMHPLWLVSMGAALSALAVIWVVALSASGDRAKAATIAFLFGALAALGLGIATDYSLPALVAVGVGAGALWSVRQFCRRGAS
ncbi:hypothetical protein P3339_10580 [Microbulbifer sp. MLAF003]|uniref:hypothetical protein n=1 Tax=unclassified Microbulbifer TaxID=2619833 RepID=UPI0024AD63C6|nr:hypothetical protein [Microbulbifer sp. MLAF003]WHI53173.1 hypothetical protein P3339_10580 [Microbulbifer sp. MLAF003]